MANITHLLKTVPGLQSLEFEEFCSVKDLRVSLRRSLAPRQSGIYMVIRERKDHPKFLARGTGGHFKNKDPNVSIDELESNWVKDALIIYVGRSGNLRTRISQLIRFGKGRPVGHYGGRLMWQIEDAEDFRVCWKTVANEEQEKTNMLAQFARAHQGVWPFANLDD